MIYAPGKSLVFLAGEGGSTEFLEPHEAHSHHIFVELFAEFVRFFVQVIIDKTHGFHRGQDSVVKLPFVIGYFHRLFLPEGPLGHCFYIGTVMKCRCKHAHLCFPDFATFDLHFLNEHTSYFDLLHRCKDNLKDILWKVELVKKDNHEQINTHTSI